MQADIVAIDTRALNLWPAHDVVAAALQASIANIEAVMTGGQWRKCHHAIVGPGFDQVRDRLQESGQRLIDVLQSRSIVARLRRQVVQKVVHRTLTRQSQGGSK